jgi:hypothetical protein
VKVSRLVSLIVAAGKEDDALRWIKEKSQAWLLENKEAAD